MDHKRFFCENIKTGLNQLSAPESHHLKNVMRLKPGDSIEIFDGTGTIAKATVKNIERNSISVETYEVHNIPPRQYSRIIIAASPPKGKRLDFMLEKCTELGADQITLVNYKRTVRLAKSNALKRFRKTMISAAKQSLTPFLPRITGPFTLIQSLDHLKKQYTNAQFFYGSSSGKYCSESQLDKNKDYIIFIGPEGGFTQNEVDLLRINNISAVSLAQNTLRIETAVIAFASLIANFRQRNKINAG